LAVPGYCTAKVEGGVPNMPVVKVTTDQDREGFSLSVEPLSDGGWISSEPGFNGITPGQVTKTYVDGQVFWAQRRRDRLALLPD
jgi:hypothetical protein